MAQLSILLSSCAAADSQFRGRPAHVGTSARSPQRSLPPVHMGPSRASSAPRTPLPDSFCPASHILRARPCLAIDLTWQPRPGLPLFNVAPAALYREA
eukprot:6182037-Alexandrium_andersonii.AAC.1